MNKAQREIYLILASEVEWAICAFCKHYECCGSACDGYVDGYCNHPLSFTLPPGHSDRDLEPDEDCWGFRPRHSIAFCADIIGTVLVNGWTMATWWEEDEKIYITGSKG